MPETLIRKHVLPVEGDVPKRGRVLFATNMWPDELRPYYGSFIASQAHSLVAAGVEVEVLYIRGFLGNRAYATAFRGLPRLTDGEYDAVHIHYGHTATVGVGIRRHPLIVSFCGEDLLGAPRDNGITRKSRAEVAAFRQVARLADRTITKSLEMERVLPKSVQARNHVLPNGVNLERFTPRDRLACRRELGWGEDEKVVLFLGNADDPRKNVALARDAVQALQRTFPGVRLHEAWGIEPEQVPVLMNASDVLVFPSLSEGSPNAIKEAMACAIPIVAAPVGDIAERLDGVAGTWVVDHSVDGFTAALVDALRVPGGRAEAAREAVSTLSVSAVAERLISIYRAAGSSIPEQGAR